MTTRDPNCTCTWIKDGVKPPRIMSTNATCPIHGLAATSSIGELAAKMKREREHADFTRMIDALDADQAKLDALMADERDDEAEDAWKDALAQIEKTARDNGLSDMDALIAFGLGVAALNAARESFSATFPHDPSSDGDCPACNADDDHIVTFGSRSSWQCGKCGAGGYFDSDGLPRVRR